MHPSSDVIHRDHEAQDQALPGLAMAEPIHFAVCVRNTGNEPSLELRKLYEVVPDPDANIDGMLRVIDESGEDYLFPSSFFVVAPLPAAVDAAVHLPAAPAGYR